MLPRGFDAATPAILMRRAPQQRAREDAAMFVTRHALMFTMRDARYAPLFDGYAEFYTS